MIIPLITHVRYRQRLRLLQSDMENAFMQQAFGNGGAGGVDPFAYRAGWRASYLRTALPGAFVIAELVNQLAVGVEQCFD